MPRVAIHLPAYNQGQYVGYALESALAQTHDDFEIILSNNHSTDSTAEVLERYEDPRLRVVMPPEFLPGVDHWMFCIGHSDSEYFAYLCSDDAMKPDFLRQQVALLDAHPRAVMAHCAAERIDADGNVAAVEKSMRSTGVIPGPVALREHIYNSRSVAGSGLFRRASFEAVGGFGGLYANDWELSFKLCAIGDIAYNQNVLFQTREWGAADRIMPKRMHLLEAVREFYETFEPQFPEHAATFKDARKKRALGMVDMLIDATPDQRQEIIGRIRGISDTAHVRAKIAAFGWGLGRPIVSVKSAKQRGKRWLKSVLQPLVTPSR